MWENVPCSAIHLRQICRGESGNYFSLIAIRNNNKLDQLINIFAISLRMKSYFARLYYTSICILNCYST